jgi:hypothetical protein
MLFLHSSFCVFGRLVFFSLSKAHLHLSVGRFVVVVDSIVKKGYGPYDVPCLSTSGLSSLMDKVQYTSCWRCITRGRMVQFMMSFSAPMDKG